MKRLVKCSLWFWPLLAASQQIPIDTWRSHYSYSSVRVLERANNTLFCAAENGLFTVNLTTRETRKLGKEDGLGDVAASAMHFSATRQKLIIGYPSGTIDIIDADGKISTITTLRDAPIVANKTIVDITSSGDNAYVATAFGVVRVNIATNTVIENYRNIGVGGEQLSVQEVEIKGDSLYVLSSGGIQAGWLQDNLLDFNDWERFPETSGGGFAQLTFSQNKWYVMRNGTALWSFNGTAWSSSGILFTETIVRLTHEGALLALSNTSIFTALPSPATVNSYSALAQSNDIVKVDDTYWVADKTNGLLALNANATNISPAGPLSDSPSRIKSINGKTFALFGPRPNQYTGASDGKGYSVFENGEWQYRTITGFQNITDVAAIGSSYYFSSLGFGLYDQQLDVRLSESNTEMVVGNAYSGVQVSALDAFNNAIWATTYNSPKTLYQVATDHSITGFTAAETGFIYPLAIEITSQGVAWVIRGSQDGGGIGVFDPASGQKRSIRTADGLPSNTVTNVSIDTEDEAWIGTSAGIGNYILASFPFNTFRVTVPIFQNRFLFENEVINDVLTDGGDRIWVATNTGVWVLSRTVSEVVHRFTMTNTALPSNNVLSFAYDGISGEVFMLTDKGLVSYRSSSSDGSLTHSSVISVFPNPVNPGFDGVVGISGLARNASVKITDTMGRIVADLIANGGSTSWDLRTFNGTRAIPGIYLIFSSSADGAETMVGKIAILK